MIIGPVVLQLASSVATLTLNRPDNDNKIDGEMTYALGEVCRMLADDDDLRLLVITASGGVFSANTPTTHDRDEGKDYTGIGPGAAVAALKIPVLVALNGDATGPGLELALAGDLRICTPSTRFGLGGLVKGVLPTAGGTQRLPRLVGPAWARDMLLTGRVVDANEALAIGLVNRVVPDSGSFDEAISELTAQIIGGSPIGARYAKEAVRQGMDLTLEQGLRLETDLNVILQSTYDRAEGLKSFLEKRGPKFTGA